MQSRLVVLVVEDEPLLMMMAAEVITELGFEVIEARHADQAIAILEKRSDVRRWPPVKILTTSGKARFAVEELPSGGRFMPKPYTAADLGTALREIIAA